MVNKKKYHKNTYLHIKKYKTGSHFSKFFHILSIKIFLNFGINL